MPIPLLPPPLLSARPRALAAAALAVALLAGCAGDGFRGSVGNFATVTRAAVETQATLDAQRLERRAERIADALARERVVLVLADCAPAPLGDEAPDRCRVVRRDGLPLERPFDALHIERLRGAFDAYAASLAGLAEGAVAGDAAFRKATTGLAASFGRLNGAIEAAGGPTAPVKDFDALGAVLAELGALHFEHQRLRALRAIVRDADPAVQEATAILAQADLVLNDARATAALPDLREAEEKVAALVDANAPEAELRAAQVELLRRVDLHRASRAEGSAFADLGAAHARLAAAAGGGGDADLRDAMALILSAARRLGRAPDAPSEPATAAPLPPRS